MGKGGGSGRWEGEVGNFKVRPVDGPEVGRGGGVEG